MKSVLIGTVEGIGLPIYLQGSAPSDYPDTFVTFWTANSILKRAFDNEEYQTEYLVTVCVYSSNPLRLEEEAARVRKALKAAGFVPDGKGHDIPSDVETHTGWACDYLFLQNEKEI